MTAYSILLEHERERANRIAPNPYRLTVREKDVVVLLGRGLDCQQIADRLSIGKRVVARHISQIEAKLGARNATHLSLIISTLPGRPQKLPSIVAIEDFREAFGMGCSSPVPDNDVVFGE